MDALEHFRELKRRVKDLRVRQEIESIPNDQALAILVLADVVKRVVPKTVRKEKL